MKTLPINNHSLGIFFQKLGHFFPIFEKGQGRPPPSPSLVTHLLVKSVYDNNQKVCKTYVITRDNVVPTVVMTKHSIPKVPCKMTKALNLKTGCGKY